MLARARAVAGARFGSKNALATLSFQDPPKTRTSAKRKCSFAKVCMRLYFNQPSKPETATLKGAMSGKVPKPTSAENRSAVGTSSEGQVQLKAADALAGPKSKQESWFGERIPEVKTNRLSHQCLHRTKK